VPDRNGQDLTTHRPSRGDAVVDIHPAVGRFLADVDTLVDERLTDDEVEARLQRVRRAAARAALIGPEGSLQSPLWRDFAGELARSGYPMVQHWLRIVLVWTRTVSAIVGHRVTLTEDDIDELAQETVARALNSFRNEARRSGQWSWPDEQELRTAFLTQCVRQLPHAYRGRLLATRRLPVDRLEELAGRPVGPVIVHALRHSVTGWRGRTAHLLRSWTYTEPEREELITTTLEVLDLAARRYPELNYPPGGAPAPGNPAVGR
jgi:hypothetical protein